MEKAQFAILRFAKYKEAVHLSWMKEQIMALMADTNLLNKKAKTEEMAVLLDKYIPAVEAMRTKLKKYDRAYKELSDENTALATELQTVKNACKEKTSDVIKHAKMQQELCELHALVDRIPTEIVDAYRKRAAGLQKDR